jgi:hypothetical protein
MTASNGQDPAGTAAAADSGFEQQPFDWDWLLQLVTEQKVIPIVGKELLVVSIDGRQTLLEHHLAARLADELRVSRERLSPNFDVNEVAVAFAATGGDPSRVYPRLKAIVEQRPLPVEPLRMLAAITDFKLFVSTTFDSLLAEALDRERGAGAGRTRRLAFSTYAALQDVPCESRFLQDPHVFQIFGTLSASGDFAVTEEDTLEFLHALQSKDRQPKILFEEFKQNHLLFLGCSFPDWLARFFVRTLVNQRLLPPARARRFVADRRVHGDLNLALFLRQCKMEIDPSGDPVAFVAELHRRWQERRPPVGQEEIRGPAVVSMASAAIFLSYASEDREAARSLKDRLEQAGLDVWLDEKSLHTGTVWEHEIEANIKRCSLFLPLLSRHAAKRAEGEFRREWRWALDRAKAIDKSVPFIQPIVIDDLPDGSEGIPKRFWKLHCSRFPQARPTEEFIERAREALRAKRLKGDR